MCLIISLDRVSRDKYNCIAGVLGNNYLSFKLYNIAMEECWENTNIFTTRVFFCLCVWHLGVVGRSLSFRVYSLLCDCQGLWYKE